VLQGAACILVLLVVRLFKLPLSPMQFALACGAVAATLSHFAGLARWWLAIQLLFAPALMLMLAIGLAPGYYLVAFLVLLAVYWSTFHTQVPLYLSSHQAWRALEGLLPADRAFAFMDIGSGLGGVLIHLAKVRPEGRYYGVESAPLPFLISWLRLGMVSNGKVSWGSFWSTDLGRYDVVFAYLSPVPMEKLWHKVHNEMRPGTLFISNTFVVPEHPPQQTIQTDDMHRSTLYVWRM